MRGLSWGMKSNSGVVLLMVLIAVVILAIVSASILFTSLNQGTSTQAQIDAIKAEQLAKGVLWDQYYQDFKAPVVSEEMDSKAFTPSIERDALDSTKYKIKVAY